MTFIGDGDEIDTAYLARYDFVLKMFDGDVCRDFVAPRTGSASNEP
jgi:hypothetical protein